MPTYIYKVAPPGNSVEKIAINAPYTPIEFTTIAKTLTVGGDADIRGHIDANSAAMKTHLQVGNFFDVQQPYVFSAIPVGIGAPIPDLPYAPPNYAEGIQKPGLFVTGGPIVHVSTLYTGSGYGHPDGKYTTLGDPGDFPGLDYIAAQDYYGIRFHWNTDFGGVQMLHTKNNRNDLVLFWGDDKKDLLRIRFIGRVPKDIDCSGKGDLSASKPSTKPDSKPRKPKNVHFDHSHFFRDVVIIEPDGSFKVNGRIYSYGPMQKWSDNRLKECIEPIDGAIAKVRALRGVSYFWNPDEVPDVIESDKRQLGFVAQEVEAVCPEAVSDTRLDDQLTKTVDYTQIVPVLVEAIKEQQGLLEQQRDRIDTLEKTLLRKGRPSHTSHRRKRLA